MQLSYREKNSQHSKGVHHAFTVVELLIVVVVIAILTSVSVVAYGGIKDRTLDSRIVSDINQVNKIILSYHAENGAYPSTGGLSNAYKDAQCHRPVDSDGLNTADWVPGVGKKLPQNPGLQSRGVYNTTNGIVGGCYYYASDGVNYVLSAWNAKKSPDTTTMYRRLGWREITYSGSDLYYCNHLGAIGGIHDAGTRYVLNADFYKYSYTISSITTCGETPPAGFGI